MEEDRRVRRVGRGEGEEGGERQKLRRREKWEAESEKVRGEVREERGERENTRRDGEEEGEGRERLRGRLKVEREEIADIGKVGMRGMDTFIIAVCCKVLPFLFTELHT
jgi:hypothetical protein